MPSLTYMWNSSIAVFSTEIHRDLSGPKRKIIRESQKYFIASKNNTSKIILVTNTVQKSQ